MSGFGASYIRDLKVPVNSNKYSSKLNNNGIWSDFDQYIWNLTFISLSVFLSNIISPVPVKHNHYIGKYTTQGCVYISWNVLYVHGLSLESIIQSWHWCTETWLFHQLVGNRQLWWYFHDSLHHYLKSAVTQTHTSCIPDSRVHWANMWPIWGRQDPGGPHVGPMNFAIWDAGCEINVKMVAAVYTVIT